jgi:hypothetical protein
MNDNYYEELIRTEAEELALQEFSKDYCELLPSDRWRIRELMIERLEAYDMFSAEAARRAA